MKYEILLLKDDEAAELRQRQWRHAARVLAIPEFITLSWMTDSAAIVDSLIAAAERAKQYQEAMSLADHWILNFFEILRIIGTTDYRNAADPEFIAVGAKFEPLREKVNMVRSAFAKLQPPGKHRRIIPSHSAIGGDTGIVYAVYDNEEREIDISRRDLANSFLSILEPLPPSQKLVNHLRAANRSIEQQFVPL